MEQEAFLIRARRVLAPRVSETGRERIEEEIKTIREGRITRWKDPTQDFMPYNDN